MQVSRQAGSRSNQKQRTRRALVEAASELLAEGVAPTVPEAAERAMVSRATAYRYFPTQDALLVEVAQVGPLLQGVEEVVGDFDGKDASQRLDSLVEAVMVLQLADEALVRTVVRVYLDTWLENRRAGRASPVRAQRRLGWVQEALAPVRDCFDEPRWRRICAVMTLMLGTEAVITMKDVAGVEDDEEIVGHLRWAAQALLQAALTGASGNVPRPKRR